MAKERIAAMPELKNEAAKLAFKNLDQVTKTTGLQKVRLAILASHEHEIDATLDDQEVHQDEVEFGDDAPTFIDGSCACPSDRWLARAAYAIRQQTAKGSTQVIVGTVPAHAPQTAAHAEHLGAAMFRLRASSGATAVVDCGSVLTAAEHREKMSMGNHVHSDLSQEEDSGACFRKTKAHRSLQEAKAQGDLDNFVGNQIVDDLCRNRAAALLPEKWEVKAYLANAEATKAYLRFAAQMLAAFHEHQRTLWQTAKDARKAQASRKPVRLELPQQEHAWSWDSRSRRWVCTLCNCRVRLRLGRQARTVCTGHWQKIQDWCRKAEANGHCTYVSVKASGEPGCIVSCKKCGQYAESSPAKLAAKVPWFPYNLQSGQDQTREAPS